MHESLYIRQWCLNPLRSRHLGTSHSSPSPLPLHIFLNLINGQSEISFLSKVILVLAKAGSHRVSNLGHRGTESPGWYEVLPKNSARDVMHEWAPCHDEAASHQFLIAEAFWIIGTVSMEECLNLMQNAMQIHCSTRSVILNAMATQYTCSFNSLYHPHWLVQWSHHCSHICIPVHSPWLPGYICVAEPFSLC